MKETDRPDPEPQIARAEPEDSHNPLWPVAIGTACLFIAMAAVMIFG